MDAIDRRDIYWWLLNDTLIVGGTMAARTLARIDANEDAAESAEDLVAWFGEAMRLQNVGAPGYLIHRFSLEESVCRNCGRLIVKTTENSSLGGGIVPLPERTWTHLREGFRVDSSCRAASYEPDEGWDDSIDRKLKAQPPKHHR